MSAAPLSSPASARRADLDWLRVAAFGGLIVYHEGLLYEPGRQIVSVLLLVTHPWRMSLLFLRALSTRDYPVLMAILMVGAFVVILGNLLADIVVAFVDPRVKLGHD